MRLRTTLEKLNRDFGVLLLLLWLKFSSICDWLTWSSSKSFGSAVAMFKAPVLTAQMGEYLPSKVPLIGSKKMGEPIDMLYLFLRR